MAAAPLPVWRTAGAAVQGAAHQKQDIPCQDALGYQVTPAGAVLAVLADGAGTAAQAAEGAQAAVRRALAALGDGLAQGNPQDEAGWQRLVLDSFSQARQALEQLAADRSLPVKDFATTLACALAVDGWLVAGQIGDGAVVAGANDGSLFTAARPQRGEYANETYFLTLPDALERVEVFAAPLPVSALALLSDGLTRLALQLPTNEPHLPFFGPILSFVAGAQDEVEAGGQLAAFLASERVCARTDDDKALILAVRSGARFAPGGDFASTAPSGTAGAE
jgi:hypothetical protein